MNAADDPIRFRKLSTAETQPGIMIWFPHAGGTSAAVVRQTSGQKIGMQTWVAVLPGREERWNEAATDLQTLVCEFDEALDSITDQPLVLTGHSFGGLLAYLLAERRSRRGLPPRALVPLAVAPPDRFDSGDWSSAGDNELIDHLDQEYGAIPAALRNNHEVLQRFLPVVRHDLRLMESYHHQPTEPLPTELVVCGGTEDQALPEDTLAGWRRFTRSSYRLQMFSGDHFFPYANFAAITNLFSSER